jgi:hypothetical protein
VQQVFVAGLHVSPPEHPPQWTVPPQPSLAYPHWGALALEHVMGWHAGPQVPFERHWLPPLQPPHCTVPPHALAIDPHATPCAMHSSGVTGEHVLAVAPAPHCWPTGQPPQSTVPPSPAEMIPHLPWHEYVVTAPQVLAIGSHTWPFGHPPHWIVWPQMERVPHPMPSSGQRVLSRGLGQATQVWLDWSHVLGLVVPGAGPQAPQWTGCPQSSTTSPHSTPRPVHVDRGVAQRPVVKSQISPDAQVNPHWSVPPQPSEIGPQRPGQAAVAVEGTHAAASKLTVPRLESSCASPAVVASSVAPSTSTTALPSPDAAAAPSPAPAEPASRLVG